MNYKKLSTEIGTILFDELAITFILDDESTMLTLGERKSVSNGASKYCYHECKFKVHTDKVLFVEGEIRFNMFEGQSGHSEIKSEDRIIPIYKHPSGKTINFHAHWNKPETKPSSPSYAALGIKVHYFLSFD